MRCKKACTMNICTTNVEELVGLKLPTLKNFDFFTAVDDNLLKPAINKLISLFTGYCMNVDIIFNKSNRSHQMSEGQCNNHKKYMRRLFYFLQQVVLKDYMKNDNRILLAYRSTYIFQFLLYLKTSRTLNGIEFNS